MASVSYWKLILWTHQILWILIHVHVSVRVNVHWDISLQLHNVFRALPKGGYLSLVSTGSYLISGTHCISRIRGITTIFRHQLISRVMETNVIGVLGLPVSQVGKIEAATICYCSGGHGPRGVEGRHVGSINTGRWIYKGFRRPLSTASCYKRWCASTCQII
jgi:hypothetical protein